MKPKSLFKRSYSLLVKLFQIALLHFILGHRNILSYLFICSRYILQRIRTVSISGYTIGFTIWIIPTEVFSLDFLRKGKLFKAQSKKKTAQPIDIPLFLRDAAHCHFFLKSEKIDFHQNVSFACFDIISTLIFMLSKQVFLS